MTKAHALLLAAALYGVWTLATYLLEGHRSTFRRPNASGARFAYTLLANIMVGTVGAAILVRVLIRAADLPVVAAYGVAEPQRVIATALAGIAFGAIVLAVQGLPTWHPTVVVNAFCQILVVSIAEVLVCWGVLGAVVRNVLGGGLLSAVTAIVVSAVAFGIYHFAHSTPFNALRMVLLLTGVGVVTGVFFFLSRDFYGTILFHNAFALRGVMQALADSGRLPFYRHPQLPLLATAAAAVLVLVVVDLFLVRPAVGTLP
jgi:hypothetical protein